MELLRQHDAVEINASKFDLLDYDIGFINLFHWSAWMEKLLERSFSQNWYRRIRLRPELAILCLEGSQRSRAEIEFGQLGVGGLPSLDGSALRILAFLVVRRDLKFQVPRLRI
jgi:hypothetical protein